MYSAYIDSAYYTSDYHGREIGADVFERMALRASDEVDQLTFGRVRRSGLDSFPNDVQDAIKLAACALAEALSIVETATDGGVITTSESVGGYSYSINADSVSVVLPRARQAARRYLAFTGLLSAGVLG